MHKLQPHTYEERRSYPRAVIRKPVVVCMDDVEIAAQIHDISVDGLQVHIDRLNFQKLHPSGKYIRRQNAPVVNVSFKLNVTGQSTELTAKCLMYYFVVLPDAGDLDIAFGLRFIAPESSLVEKIDTYIINAMRPEEDTGNTILTEPRSITELTVQPELGTWDIQMELMKLLQENNITVPESREDNNHLCMVTAIQNLFEKCKDLENRLYRLEQKTGQH